MFAMLRRLLPPRPPVAPPPVRLEETACDLCGGTQTTPLCEKSGLTVVRCADCGLCYTNPRLSEADALRRYSPTYFEREYLPYLRREAAAIDAHFTCICAEVGRLAPPGPQRRMLELGCGAGTLLDLASHRYGWQVTGVEYNATAVRYARRRYRLRNVVRSDLYHVDFPPESFEVVLMCDVIEHVFRPRELIGRIRRWLVPGGLAFFATPNIESASFTRLGAAWDAIGPDEHLYYFSERTLGALLSQVGLRPLECHFNNADRDALFLFARAA
jgi:SAM-dependent methyltransferase